MVKWHEKLVEKCDKNKIELSKDGPKKLLFVCANIPSEELQKELIKELPSGFTFEFLESPKSRSIYMVKNLLGIYISSMRIDNSYEITLGINKKNRKLYIRVSVSIPDDSPFWNEINKALIQDGYFKGWEYENTSTNEKHVFDLINMVNPIQSKPLRDMIIQDEEIKDLHIILNDPRMTWDKLMETI